ncbi:MAG: flagellar hook-length control protein FliK [Clostridium sp.]|nr:flagellar hook-length control protein FliK [Clostridium sp.]MCM1170671.1 flagellar hook-length control protein FliK [Clostridium sp.]MCM1209812.1 flagellar hook-length control protein FliK [Ruminococcus sp.]
MAITTTGISPFGTKPSPKAKAKEKDETAADAFSSLIMSAASMNGTDKKDVAKSTDGKMDVSGVADINKADVKTNAGAKNEPKKTTDKEPVKNNADTGAAKEAAGTKKAASEETTGVKTAETGEADVVEDDTEELALNVVSELTDIIKDLLGIDDEELDKLLTETGYQISDLMVKSNLTDFILQANDATSVDALINEDLNNLLKTASSLLDNLMEKFDISSVDVEAFAAEAGKVLADLENETQAFVKEDIPVQEEALADDTVSEVKVTTVSRHEEPEEPKVTITTEHEETVQSTVTKAQQSDNAGSERHSDRQDAKADILNNLNQALESISDADMVNPLDSFTESVSEADIVRQIIDEIKVNMSRETTSLELQLNPEHLGKVQISVSTRNGIMQAQIVTENEAARHAVEASMATLRETLDNQGLKVEAVEVMVATYEFFGNGKEQQGSPKGQNADRAGKTISDSFSDEELEDDEQLEQELMQAQGNTVSYMA